MVVVRFFHKWLFLLIVLYCIVFVALKCMNTLLTNNVVKRAVHDSVQGPLVWISDYSDYFDFQKNRWGHFITSRPYGILPAFGLAYSMCPSWASSPMSIPTWIIASVGPLLFCIWFQLVNRYSVYFVLLLSLSTVVVVVVVIAETVGLAINDMTNSFLFPHKGLKTAFSPCSTIAFLLFSQLAKEAYWTRKPNQPSMANTGHWSEICD